MCTYVYAQNRCNRVLFVFGKEEETEIEKTRIEAEMMKIEMVMLESGREKIGVLGKGIEVGFIS